MNSDFLDPPELVLDEPGGLLGEFAACEAFHLAANNVAKEPGCLSCYLADVRPGEVLAGVRSDVPRRYELKARRVLRQRVGHHTRPVAASRLFKRAQLVLG